MAEVWQAEGKTFIITGGASGLGAAYVEAFLKDGAKNIAILDIAEEVGVALSQRLNGTYGNKTVFLKCDVSKEEDIKSAFDGILDRFKQIDVVINNAGILNDAENVWRKSCEVNVEGVISFTRKAVSHMRKDEGGAGGTIVNVSSIAGIMKFPITPAYCGTKAAVLHFSLSLAQTPFYEKTGVRVLTICFGPTQTPLMQNLTEKSIDRETTAIMEQRVPYSTFQQVESAMKAMVKMFEVGSNGSLWLSVNNRPAEDITQVMNGVYASLSNVIANGLEAS